MCFCDPGAGRLARLITQVELHWLLRLRLHHNCPPSDLRAGLHIADAESHQITASEFAVDGQLEQRKLASPMGQLQL
ncbi:hypothetical protein NB231_14508 [Nitrococcus mobilis Nb-231]|uniref:Uncharacterized protein n=1 Tax=Nitrococcus mobilis Nb-231 TaxID=314278 RepID=A4BL52_9GAMM|nr:hypothetical protein NB231_14508 [Nitrococcus mobilis Nb-231]